jgi:hypothetical protein
VRRQPDPYVDMAQVVPYTVNWQVKQRLGGKEGTTLMDLKRLIGLMKAGGYRGSVPIETLPQPGKEYDPVSFVPHSLKEVGQAIAETAQSYLLRKPVPHPQHS